VRLDVHIFGVEELLRAFAGQVFHFVGILTATVIAAAGIAFGVLIGEDAAGGFKHRFGGEVFACDQFNLGVLTTRLLEDELMDKGIDFSERARDGFMHGQVGTQF